MLGELSAWLFSDELGRDKLALIVLCTLGISVLASQLSWRFGARRETRQGRAGRLWVKQWLVESLRVLYCVGLPMGIIWRGALVREMGLPVTVVEATGFPRGAESSALAEIVRWMSWLGLTNVRVRAQLGAGLAAGVGALVVLAVLWVWYVRTVLVPSRSSLEAPLAVPWWEALRLALLSQFLWALYRGFALSLVPERAQAALVALALISIPWALDPQRRRDLLSLQGYRVVEEWLIALFTVLVSLASNLLWFLVLMHVLWVWVGRRLLAHLAERFLSEVRLSSAS